MPCRCVYYSRRCRECRQTKTTVLLLHLLHGLYELPHYQVHEFALLLLQLPASLCPNELLVLRPPRETCPPVLRQLDCVSDFCIAVDEHCVWWRCFFLFSARLVYLSNKNKDARWCEICICGSKSRILYTVFTLCSRLYNRLYNGLYNRLYELSR